jgi:23S rRNA pseudouridine2457 synthase
MTAAVGLPTLRLVRVRIGSHRLDGLAPGAWRIEPAPPARAGRDPSAGSSRTRR